MKDKYIAMRNNKEFDLNFFWQFYKSNGGLMTDANQFQEYFLYDSETIQGRFIINRQERNRDEILLGMDKKLGLTTLYDRDNNFIRCIK